ncbi:hypothetical protein [Kitasatospora sp. P5_F3]
MSGERADLVSAKLDDRSQAGLTIVWAVAKVQNHSSKTSNYSIGYEVVRNSNNEQVWSSSWFFSNVSAGQLATQESPVNIPTGEKATSFHINITTFDRTAATG